MAEGAPVIHDESDTVGIFDAAHNISHHIEGQTVGDAEMDAAFARADHVFETTFEVQQMQHTPIEPHVTIGWLDEDERLVLRSSTQVPFHIRRMLAPLLGLPVKAIRIIKPRMGGGFGSKQEMVIEDIVGHLVIATRRPVRLVFNREEEFISSRTRHSQTLTYRTGVSDDGHLLAQDLRVVSSTGAYGTHGFTVNSLTGARGLSLYNCPAKRFNCDVAYTNRPVAGAFRGYGAPQAFFGLESQMDDIARALHLDPVAFRRTNWVKSGDALDILPRLGERGGVVEEISAEDMPHVTTCGLEECVAQGLRAIGWHRREDPLWRQPPDRPHIRRGIGLALCMQGSGIPFVDMGASSIKINDDGSFNLLVGAADLGTGADTVFAQIAADVLGVATDDILVYSGDTDFTPFDVGAYASSTTYISGMAVKKAAEAARVRIVERAARLLNADAEEIELRDRRAWAADGQSISIGDIALNALHTEDQEQIMGTASHWSTESPAPFAAQLAEIEVDIDTGQITVNKLVMAVDCGVAINPVSASGQVEGGMVQALGYAMTEETVLDDLGRPLNARLGRTGSSGPTTHRPRRSSSCKRWRLPAPSGQSPSPRSSSMPSLLRFVMPFSMRPV